MSNDTELKIRNLPEHWKLVPIPKGRKGPIDPGWNTPENCLSPRQFDDTYDGNLGLAHAYSGTCALDIDDLEQTRAYFLGTFGESLDELLADPGYPQISSGRDNRAKVIFSLPEPLQSIRVGELGHTFFELRCGTRDGSTVQDVLPPSIHPGTGLPYRWVHPESLRSLPPLPSWLHEYWLERISDTKDAAFRADAPEPPREALREQYPDEKLESMLRALDPDMGRDEWLHVGMALHWLDPGLYGLWDRWSSAGTKYSGAQDTLRVWQSFHGGGTNLVTIRTLEGMARRAGWMDTIKMPSLTPAPAADTPSGASAKEIPADDTEPQQSDAYENAIHVCERWASEEKPPVAQIQRELVEVLRTANSLDPVLREALVSVARGYLPTTLKGAVKPILKELEKERDRLLREKHLQEHGDEIDRYFRDWVYVADQDVVFHLRQGVAVKPSAFQNMTRRLDAPEGPTIWERFIDGEGAAVQSISFDPDQPLQYEDGGIRYANRWHGYQNIPEDGDPTPWHDLVELVIPNPAEREHFYNYCAHTLQFPGVKINHGVLLAGAEGCGKDSIIEPLRLFLGDVATGGYAVTVHGRALAGDYNGHLLGAKMLVYNETAHGSQRGETTYQAHQAVAERLKEVCAAPPDYLHVNPKYGREIRIRNICSTFILSNSTHPLVATDSRRFFAVWSPLRTRDPVTGDPLGTWGEYWPSYWGWLRAGGWKAVAAWLFRRDLTRWEAGRPPPKTAFWRSIEEESQSPLEALLTSEGMRDDDPYWSTGLVTIPGIQAYLAQTGAYREYGLKEVPGPKAISSALGHLTSSPGQRLNYTGPKGERRKTRKFWMLRGPSLYDGLSLNEIAEMVVAAEEEVMSRNSGNVVAFGAA